MRIFYVILKLWSIAQVYELTKCPNCGIALDIQAEDTQSIVFAACRSCAKEWERLKTNGRIVLFDDPDP
jgi:hypothetical protein